MNAAPGKLKPGPALRYRLGVASRAAAAILGGYMLAACATAVASLLLPLARADAVIMATLLSFAVYACAALWVFAARSAWRAWLGVVVPTAVLAFGLLLYRSAA